MFKVSREKLQGQDIIVLGAYRPWTYHKENGGDGSTYPEHSGRILDIKSGEAKGIDYFADFMTPRVKTPEIIVVVPSHDPEKTTSGMTVLAGRVAQGCGCIDGSGILVRHTKIQKLSAGGNRSFQVHLDSMLVSDPAAIAGKQVLLIDDVMTTGHSLVAARRLLLEAGAAKVLGLALGRTTY